MPSEPSQRRVLVRPSAITIAEGLRTYTVQIDSLMNADGGIGIVIYDDQKIAVADDRPILFDDLVVVAGALHDLVRDGGYFFEFSSELDGTRTWEYSSSPGTTLLRAWSRGTAGL